MDSIVRYAEALGDRLRISALFGDDLDVLRATDAVEPAGADRPVPVCLENPASHRP